MKSILISIKPQYVAKILNGEKTIEIRKTMPKCDLPIDVYIYCTKDKKDYLYYDWNKDIYGTTDLVDLKNGWSRVCCGANRIRAYQDKHNILTNGHILAKFTLNKVDEYNIQHPILEQHSIYKNKEYHGELETSHNDIVDKGCISPDLVQKYLDLDELGEGTLFGWHIDNLEIFDKPKELSEFKRCTEKTCIYGKCHKYMHCLKSLTKAPQSFMFIEYVGNNKTDTLK